MRNEYNDTHSAVGEQDVYIGYFEPDEIKKAWLKKMLAHRLLTPEEEISLCKQAKEGSLEALDELVRCNFRFIFTIARKIYIRNNGKFDLFDLIQDGIEGFIVTVDKFDSAKRYRLNTYSVYWVRQNINRQIDETGKIIRKPVHVSEKRQKIDKIIALNPENKPSWEEIQGKVKTRLPLECFFEDTESLDQIGGLNQEDDFEDEIHRVADNSTNPATLVQGINLRREVLNALLILDERQRMVISLRFGLFDGTPQTLDEIGLRIKRSRERVRQIEQQALKILSLHPRLREEVKTI